MESLNKTIQCTLIRSSWAVDINSPGVDLEWFTGFLETTQTLDQTLESDKLFLRTCLKILGSSILLFSQLTNYAHLKIPQEKLSLVMCFIFTLNKSSRNLSQPRGKLVNHSAFNFNWLLYL